MVWGRSRETGVAGARAPWAPSGALNLNFSGSLQPATPPTTCGRGRAPALVTRVDDPGCCGLLRPLVSSAPLSPGTPGHLRRRQKRWLRRCVRRGSEPGAACVLLGRRALDVAGDMLDGPGRRRSLCGSNPSGSIPLSVKPKSPAHRTWSTWAASLGTARPLPPPSPPTRERGPDAASVQVPLSQCPGGFFPSLLMLLYYRHCPWTES